MDHQLAVDQGCVKGASFAADTAPTTRQFLLLTPPYIA
jgi:hypothetical protein